jgi:MarR family transcriptional regulator, organic hydroperoxide resistance regulator
VDERQIVKELTMTQKKLRAIAGSVLTPYGVRLGQNLVLEELWQTDGLTPGEIAARLGITGPTAVRMAQRMEDSGLVTRKRDHADGRLVRVYLTEQGRRLQQPIEADFRKLHEQSLSGISPADRKRLTKILKSIQDNLAHFDVAAGDDPY